MKYRVEKTNIKTEEVHDYGALGENEMKIVTKGYHFNGLFYEKKNSNYIITVEQVF